MKSDDSPALKMPPPPPRNMNHTTTALNNDSNYGSSFNDSLARLYATAKQLDTVASLDCHTNVDNDDDHPFPGGDAYPVVRRERSVSDTELFNFKTATSIPLVEMHHDEKHSDGSAESANGTTTTMMMMVDDQEDDIDEIIHAASSGMPHPKQRIRSASCGSGSTATNNKVTAVVSLSPSHHYCETIVEEEL
jgi:hypothetical protein